MEISQDQILGEENYASIGRQSLCDGHILVLWHAPGLNAQKGIEKVGKKTKSFSKVLWGPKRKWY